MLLVLTLATALAVADLSLQHDTQTRGSLSETSRVLLGSGQIRISAAKMTCDKYPRVCRAKGSPGRDCCKKRCVDTWADRVNCGACGKRCGFWEICCKGKCVNPKSDRTNCGACSNRCRKGNSCVYGMCSYGD